MRRLLKYAFVLALGIAIGAYIVLDNIVPDTAEQGEITARSEAAPAANPASIEEEELEYSVAKRLASLDGWRAFLAAHPNGAYAQSARAEIARRRGASSASADGSAAAPALSPTDNEQAYALSERLGSLASHAQSATAKVERLLLAGKVSASGDAEASGAASSETRAASESPSSVSSASGDAVPATDTVASHDASQDAKPAENAARHFAPRAGTDGAAGARLAALGRDEICRRDEDRLAQLRMNPSRGEAERFAGELGCEKLRPQVLALFESLSPRTPAPADTLGAASPGAQAENESAHPAASLASADAASPISDATCKRDEDRLVRLRSSPSGEEALRFEKELGCEKLRPQLQRLMESLDLGAPAPPAPPDSPHSYGRSNMRKRALRARPPAGGAFRRGGWAVLARDAVRRVASAGPPASGKPQRRAGFGGVGRRARRAGGAPRHLRPACRHRGGFPRMPARDGGTQPGSGHARP